MSSKLTLFLGLGLILGVFVFALLTSKSSPTRKTKISKTESPEKQQPPIKPKSESGIESEVEQKNSIASNKTPPKESSNATLVDCMKQWRASNYNKQELAKAFSVEIMDAIQLAYFGYLASSEKNRKHVIEGARIGLEGINKLGLSWGDILKGLKAVEESKLLGKEVICPFSNDQLRRWNKLANKTFVEFYKKTYKWHEIQRMPDEKKMSYRMLRIYKRFKELTKEE